MGFEALMGREGRLVVTLFRVPFPARVGVLGTERWNAWFMRLRRPNRRRCDGWRRGAPGRGVAHPDAGC